MTAFYDRAIETALRQMKDKGQLVTLTSTASDAGTAASSAVDPTASTATQTGYGVLNNYTARSIDGTLIQAGDKELMLAAQGVGGVSLSPQPESRVTLADGTVWTVKRVEPYQPGGVTIYFTLQLRA